MNTRTKALSLLCAGLVACGTAEGTQGTHQISNAKPVVLQAAGGLALVSPETGEVAKRIAGGVASPDRASFVSATSEGAESIVTRTTPAGKVVASYTVPRRLDVRVVSDDLVALTERPVPSHAHGTSPYLPEPKDRTFIVVLDADGTSREYMLGGNFEPEAFKVDNSELFMIEYIPAMAPERYQVRRLKLGSGAVKPIGRLKQGAPGQMQGTGRTQVMSPAGDELYTLYTQQLDAGHAGEEHAAEEHDAKAHAFVHLLNLQGAWAHCIDLPSVFASGQATASALAVNTAGSRVYVADWTNGAVAEVNPRRVRVVKTVNVDFGAEDDSTFAAADANHLFVAGLQEVVVLDAESLEEIDRWTYEEEITGLSVVDDRLFVSLGDGGLVDVREV
jgi:hypothetical protein